MTTRTGFFIAPANDPTDPYAAGYASWVVRLPLGPQGCDGCRRAPARTLREARAIAERHHGWRGTCRLMRCADGSYAVMAPGTRSTRPGWITWTTISRCDRASSPSEASEATR